MNWIIFFTTQKITYQVYKLNQSDSIVLKNTEEKNLDIIIILTGIISLAKIFCNKEVLPLAILNKNDIISQSKVQKTNYQITALKTSYVIKIKEQNLYQKNIKAIDKPYIIAYYQQTIEKYEETLSIINQQNKTKKILLFLLHIFWRFGSIHQYKIIISFKLTKNCISIMTATSINTVNKIIKKICMNKKKKINFIKIKNLKLI
uniref:Global nitrogen transcriptional regulator n=1 Tax=Leptosiphonia brodiei TaxID=2608611 RepID=A0A1Z1MB02_9FLOR|nr:global nitrogen transcriptional regulator [Leptosiphonia brodiei]ARW62995.1 global nitrogen transcriptional regulator [Leptosiphonia brodiei]